jgi:hypothetical protein
LLITRVVVVIELEATFNLITKASITPRICSNAESSSNHSELSDSTCKKNTMPI